LSHEDFVGVYPTHGAGSLCSTGIASTPQTTIGFERRYNPLLQPMDVDAFAAALLTGQPAFPRYFGRMRPTNQAGPRLVGARPPLPPPIAVDAARGMLRGDAVLVDLRPGRAHADGHPPGSVSIPAGSSFGTWLGWVVEPDRPLVLLVDSTTDVDDAIRQAYRVGYETVVGLVDGGWPAWLAAGGPVETTRELTTVDLAGWLASEGGRQVVLDVRQRTEYESAHIPGSWHLLAGWLPDRLAALPPDRPIVTICASGFRSSIAASLLRRAGFSDVAWVSDGVPDWAAAGFPIERGEPAGQDQSPAPTRP
jgi:hydroxyacylglutathione hydrolase